MNDTQIFQLFGLSLTVMGLAWIIDPRSLVRLVKNMLENESVLLLYGLLALISGYLLVTFHNTWTGGSATVITLLGWLALIKGLFITMIPPFGIKLAKFPRPLRKYFNFVPWIVLIVGLFSLYIGYLA